MHLTKDWVSCYVFTEISFDTILIEAIRPLLQDLKTKNLINGFFFVRYWENGPHLRLRVLPINILVKKVVIELIQRYISNYYEAICSNYSLEFNDYIHEVQRYGGRDNIKIAQKHFNDSSNIVLNNIYYAKDSWDYNLAISYAIQMHLIFAKKIIIDKSEAILYFETLFDKVLINSVKLDNNQKASIEEILKVKSFFIESYEKQKSVIGYIVESIWLGEMQNNWIKNWSLNCTELSNAMNEKYKNVKMPAPEWFEFEQNLDVSIERQIQWSIYDSYIHMTNNRLGIFLRDEAFITFSILTSLKSLK